MRKKCYSMSHVSIFDINKHTDVNMRNYKHHLMFACLVHETERSDHNIK